MNFLKSYLKSESGNFSVIAGLSMVPILITIGAAMDYSRLANVDKNLQDAVDNAALGAAVAYMQEGSNQMKKDGVRIFNANSNLNNDLKIDSFNVTKEGENFVHAEASATLTPLFMSGFGVRSLEVNVASTATIGATIGAEVAIAIDTTNSMAFGTSWNDTMGTIEGLMEDMQSFTGDDNFYVTLVPFQDRVNIEDRSKSWMNSSGFSYNDWDGCVEPREEEIGAFEWMLDDTAPKKQKFVPTHEDAIMSDGRSVACPKVPITGPTNDIDEVIKATKKLSTNGTGRYDVGLAWAWRSLSPNWSGQWGVSDYPSVPPKKNTASSNDKVRKKYIVYMTDGRSNAFKLEAMQEESWGWNNGSKQAFEHIAEMCETIKAQDIEIYMLQIPGNSNSTPYFESCASSPDHYVIVDDVEDISIAFGDIKNSLFAEVRTVR